jgi:hypothetical protein
MTPAVPEAARVAYLVIEALEALGVPYHIGGSYASSIHGVPRQTHDVDLIVDPRAEHLAALVARLEGEFYVEPEMLAEALVHRSSCNLVHLKTGVKVDLFVKGASAFDRAEFEHRQLVPLVIGSQQHSVFVKSAEDTVLRKLLWYELGGRASDRQWSDLLGIVRTQGDRLDLPYLRRWADELGLRELLDELVRQEGSAGARGL